MRKLTCSLMLLLQVNAGMACTTFFMQKNGQMVFGRNYDWVTGTGMVHTNLRGLVKQSLTGGSEKSILWTSKYGSVTFNQFGKEFPNGGMNEKGLVVELMWLNDTRYPEPDERPGINVLQWIQYQLDNCATIEEVLATDKDVRIVSTGTPQHYLIADAGGRAATIELLNGKMVVHTGKDLPLAVLTNSTYQQSTANLGRWQGKTGKTTPPPDNSIQRFTTACTMVQEYQSDPSGLSAVDASFNILQKVALGSYTQWSIVYDLTNKKIYFKSRDFRQVKTISMQAFRFECNAAPEGFAINQPAGGDISSAFSRFSAEENETLMKTAFMESSSRFTLNENLIAAAARYPNSVRCR